MYKVALCCQPNPKMYNHKWTNYTIAENKLIIFYNTDSRASSRMRSLCSNHQVVQWQISSSWIPNAIYNSYQIPWNKIYILINITTFSSVKIIIE